LRNFQEKAKLRKFLTGSEKFVGIREGNLKQGGMHHCLGGGWTPLYELTIIHQGNTWKDLHSETCDGYFFTMCKSFYLILSVLWKACVIKMCDN